MQVRRHMTSVYPKISRNTYNQISAPQVTQPKYEDTIHYLPMNRIYNNQGGEMNIDKLLQHEPEKCNISASNDLGHMTSGIRNIKGNNVLVFIHKKEIPRDKRIIYGNMVYDFRSNKEDKYRTRLTVGGDRLDYEGNQSSPTASLLGSKLLINIVIGEAHRGAKILFMDLKDHFYRVS